MSTSVAVETKTKAKTDLAAIREIGRWRGSVAMAPGGHRMPMHRGSAVIMLIGQEIRFASCPTCARAFRSLEIEHRQDGTSWVMVIWLGTPPFSHRPAKSDSISRSCPAGRFGASEETFS
jgi:hypothetical protein